MLSSEEIVKVVLELVGNTNASGCHSTDMDERVPRVKVLGKVTESLSEELVGIADSWEDRSEASISAVGMTARVHSDEVNRITRRYEEGGTK